MTLGDILLSKGHLIHTIGPSATLEEVVQKLVHHNCGSLVVYEGEPGDGGHRGSGHMRGIITERDILKACAAHRGSFTELTVVDVMTVEVVTGSPSDSVEDTMGLMTDARIRHLPVVEGEHLLGLISIGDVVKIQHNQLTMENHYLKSYILG